MACKSKTTTTTAATDALDPNITGLTSPITVYTDDKNAVFASKILTADYFNVTASIDSVSASAPFAAKLNAEKTEIDITLAQDKPHTEIGTLQVFIKGKSYTIVLRNWYNANAQAELPVLKTLTVKGEEIEFESRNARTIVALWDNQKLYLNQLKSDTIWQHTLKIPADAAKVKRSFMRVYGAGLNGLSNELLIPLEYGKVMTDTKAITRQDFEAQIMYFPFIDRFNDANKANNAPLKDERVLPQANYQGGDIAGITAKIKDGYFKSMNISCIWLSPITQNPPDAWQEFPEPHRWFSGYHGYWPISSSKVDSRYGTDAELKDLMETAHANGINVILDFVAHHVHQSHPMFKQHPDWITALDIPNPDPKGKEKTVKNIRLWDGATRTTTWFDTFMPTLDLSRPDVIKMQADSAMFWIKKFGFDGYRHDAAKHVPLEFWRYLSRKMKDEVIIPNNKHVYQVGETYGSDDLIASYIGSGLMDSQFDFNLFFTARDAFAEKGSANFKDIANAMKNTFRWYGSHSTMAYITGNHDQPRFMGYAGKDLKADENDREAGWHRTIGIKDSTGYNKLQQLIAFTLTIPGVPCIYYGDEIGMTGANDPDNRRMMTFTGWNKRESQTKRITEQLTALRASSMALIYGDTEILKADENTLVYSRQYFDEKFIIIFNRQNKPADIVITRESNNYTSQFGGAITGGKDGIMVNVPANGFEILKSKK